MRAAGFVAALGLLPCLFLPGGATLAQPSKDAPPLKQDGNYRLISPQPIATGDKIEVIDFFWYGCPYCNQLQPALNAWIASKPADVEVRRVPVIIRDSWAPHARIFYTLEALGEVDRLHQEVYRGYHVEELRMSNPDVMAQWAARHGIARDRWLQAYNSELVAGKVRLAQRSTRDYDIQGTPSLVVDGRYLTSGGMNDDIPEMIPVLDQLIRLARAGRAAKQ
jgi:thiol:disulfide interchange protein DsbA